MTRASADPDAGMAEARRMVPFIGPVDASVVLPGSKSFTNRALVCAALATGVSTLEGVLESDDTEAMFGCLDDLGIAVEHDASLHRAVVRGAGGASKVVELQTSGGRRESVRRPVRRVSGGKVLCRLDFASQHR